MSTLTVGSKSRKHHIHIRKTPSEILTDVIIILFFIALSLLCIYPFYYLLINSVSEKELVESGAVNFYPVGIQFQSLKGVFETPSFMSGLAVSIFKTVVATVLMVFTSAWAGYLFSKKKMWMRTFWYRFLVVTMYFSAGLVPWYINMVSLDMKDNILAYILPCIVAPYNIILVKTYVDSLPKSLEESAVIDGASVTGVFFKIVLPLSLPIVVAVAIFGAIENWNSFTDSLLLMSGEGNLRSLQHVLYAEAPKLDKAIGSNMYVNSYQFASAMISVVPILIAYPFIHRYLIKCAGPETLKK